MAQKSRFSFSGAGPAVRESPEAALARVDRLFAPLVRHREDQLLAAKHLQFPKVA
jgi:hypothetical protein